MNPKADTNNPQPPTFLQDADPGDCTLGALWITKDGATWKVRTASGWVAFTGGGTPTLQQVVDAGNDSGANNPVIINKGQSLETDHIVPNDGGQGFTDLQTVNIQNRIVDGSGKVAIGLPARTLVAADGLTTVLDFTAQQAIVASPTGGVVQDAEARAAIDSLIALLKAAGIMASA